MKSVTCNVTLKSLFLGFCLKFLSIPSDIISIMIGKYFKNILVKRNIVVPTNPQTRVYSEQTQICAKYYKCAKLSTKKIGKPRFGGFLPFRPWRWSAGTYCDFGLAQCRRYIQVLGYHHVTKVVSVLNAPHGQPVDVIHGQITRQLDFNVLPLIAFQGLQTVNILQISHIGTSTSVYNCKNYLIIMYYLLNVEHFKDQPLFFFYVLHYFCYPPRESGKVPTM